MHCVINSGFSLKIVYFTSRRVICVKEVVLLHCTDLKCWKYPVGNCQIEKKMVVYYNSSDFVQGQENELHVMSSTLQSPQKDELERVS